MDDLEKITENPLERLRYGAGIGLMYVVTAVAFAGNEVAQQIKHGYYHVRNIPHEKISLDEYDPDSFFDKVYRKS